MQDDPGRLIDLADAALDQGEEEVALVRTGAWLAGNPPHAGLLHWHALLLRAAERHDEALAALRRAAVLAPTDAGIARSLAQVALEAGEPASRLFELAIRLEPNRPELRLGLHSARFSEGDGYAVRDELGGLLTGNPGWLEGHRQFAQLSAQLGMPEEALASIEGALVRFPQSGALYLLGIELLIDAERYEEALALAARAAARFGKAPPLVLAQATAEDELGCAATAGELFAGLGAPQEAGHAVRLIRHYLRQGRIADASRTLKPWLDGPNATPMWPYAALAWRLAGDPRASWLEEQAGLLRTVDLDTSEVEPAELAACLRGLHAHSGRFLDQSVRGGTQTDGPLFARIEPELRMARAAVRRALAAYIADLPPHDPQHPQLALRRDRALRFSGSWSVRLVDAGHHASHHHPQGWFSAVLYVAVPPALPGAEGRLVLGGSPTDLALPLAPLGSVAPHPGRLAIFPSTMWHATLPFSAGERLTIAFDVARPCGGPVL